MFRLFHGVMGSGKTAKLLKDIEHSDFRWEGKTFCVFTGGKPSDCIVSRNGESIPALPTSRLAHEARKHSVIFVDEAQWLTLGELRYLHKLSAEGYTVRLYGITNDVNGHMYEAMGLAFCLGATPFEIQGKKLCPCCLRSVRPTMHINVGSMDTKEDYKAVCSACYYKGEK